MGHNRIRNGDLKRKGDENAERDDLIKRPQEGSHLQTKERSHRKPTVQAPSTTKKTRFWVVKVPQSVAFCCGSLGKLVQ